jgi:flagellar biosynthesis anti-sigma factor FlgM
MTIKINGNRPEDMDGTRRVATARPEDAPSSNRTAAQTSLAAAKTDRVEVSKDAQLMTSALKAANDSSSIRHDMVDRMRQLLDAGEIGRDTGKVADALIDHMLNK